MKFRTAALLLVALGVAVPAVPCRPAAAQQPASATVREILRVVKTGRTGSPQLEDARIGTSLQPGDRVRTGGRSAAGLRFQDRSLLRLGELTEVVIASPNGREVRVNRGQVFADYATPGTLSGSYAVAAVRGTNIEYTVDEERGEARVRIYKGRGFVGAADNPVYAAATTDLAGTTLQEQGLIGSQVDWAGGEARFTDGPLAGQLRGIVAFDRATGTVTLDAPVPNQPGTHGFLLVKQRGSRVVELLDNTGTTIPRLQPPTNPYRVPKEQYAGIRRHSYVRELRDGKQQTVFIGTDAQRKVSDDTFGERRALSRSLRRQLCDCCDPSRLPLRTTDLDDRMAPHGYGAGAAARRALHTALAGRDPASSTPSARGTSTGGRTAPPPTPEQIFLPQQVRPPRDDQRRMSQFLFEPFGVAADNYDALGTRARFQGVQGDLFVELGYMYTLENGRSRHDLSEGFLQVRTRYGDFIGGRQHLFLRLANNQDVGTLLGLETTDAVVWDGQPGGGVRAQGGYIFDTNALDPGGLRGAFSRAQVPVGRGIVGYSLLASADGHPNLGWSLDASYPLLPNTLDIYGEGGSDVEGRRLFTAGLYVPALYERARLDVFVEFAHRENIEDRASLRLRRELGRGLLLVAFIDHRSKDGVHAGGGVVWSLKFR